MTIEQVIVDGESLTFAWGGRNMDCITCGVMCSDIILPLCKQYVQNIEHSAFPEWQGVGGRGMAWLCSPNNGDFDDATWPDDLFLDSSSRKKYCRGGTPKSVSCDAMNALSLFVMHVEYKTAQNMLTGWFVCDELRIAAGEWVYFLSTLHECLYVHFR